MNLGTAQVIRANSRSLPLADNSVDLVVSSPPYWSLRAYQDNGETYDGQIGAEATPGDFVDSLIEVTRELVRVTKPSGSIWINLGDKYAQAEERSRNGNGNRKAIDNFVSGSVLREPTVTLGRKNNDGVRQKSLIGIPWRYALRCIDDLGLILRAEVIWSKPNGLPESVTDRVRRSHEQWFHFTLQPRYFSAVDEIREGYAPGTAERYAYGFKPASAVTAGQSSNGPTRADGGGPGATNPLGKLPGSVWTIPTEPLKVPDHLGVDHFAAFPTEWPKRIISGWSPAGVCVECGEGRRIRATHPCATCGEPWIDQAKKCHACGHSNGDAWKQNKDWANDARMKSADRVPLKPVRGIKTGTVELCACPEPTAPTTPAVVLDPFAGTGTVALVAKALGRHGIAVDMSADYCRLAEWRTNDRNQLAKVLGVEKADAPDPGQLDLFGGDAA